MKFNGIGWHQSRIKHAVKMVRKYQKQKSEVDRRIRVSEAIIEKAKSTIDYLRARGIE